MKRRTFFRHSALGTAVWAASTAVVTAQSTPQVQDKAGNEADKVVSSPPVVMAPRHDGAEILWAVPSLSRGWVEYGATPELGQKADSTSWGFVPQNHKVLKVRLEGLQPGTKYYYRCVTERQDESKATHQTQVGSFRTLDPTASSTSFSVWNDTHERTETIRALAEATPECDFLLWNGDTCNDWKNPDLFTPTILAPAGGVELTSRAPLFLVRGNHDVRGPWAFQLPDYTAMPQGRPYYSFRTGPVAVLCLDTGEDKPDHHEFLYGRAAFEPLRREQAEWIKQETAKPEFATAPYRLVFCHLPLRWIDEVKDIGYDIFSKRSRDLWHEPLVKWGAQVIISGHTHQQAWMPSDAQFPYAQITGGGPQLDRATIITGQADASLMRLTVRRIADGQQEVHEFKPLT